MPAAAMGSPRLKEWIGTRESLRCIFHEADAEIYWLPLQVGRSLESVRSQRVVRAILVAFPAAARSRA